MVEEHSHELCEFCVINSLFKLYSNETDKTVTKKHNHLSDVNTLVDSNMILSILLALTAINNT